MWNFLVRLVCDQPDHVCHGLDLPDLFFLCGLDQPVRVYLVLVLDLYRVLPGQDQPDLASFLLFDA